MKLPKDGLVNMGQERSMVSTITSTAGSPTPPYLSCESLTEITSLGLFFICEVERITETTLSCYEDSINACAHNSESAGKSSVGVRDIRRW